MDTQSTNSSDFKRRDIWLEATKRLSEEEKRILRTQDLGGANLAQAALDATRTQKSICKGKQWSFSFKGKQVFVRDILESIISWIEKFKEIVDFVVSMDVSGHAALPWGCIKFCLEMAGKDVQKYGSMLIGMEIVTKEIKFYTLFEAIYLTKPLQSANQLADTLVETYENLLRFLAKACKYYSTGTFARVIKAPFSEDGVDDLTNSVEHFRSLIERNARLIDREISDQEQRDIAEAIKSWNEPLESMRSQVSEINTLMKEVHSAVVVKHSAPEDPLTTIRSSLRLPHQRDIDKRYRKNLERMCKGTATWIFERPEFRSWSCGQKPVLTIRGSPGCGKSFLSTMVVRHFLENKDQNIPIGYYYFRGDDESKQSVNNALCAMVYQIADQNLRFAERAARTCLELQNSLAVTLSSTWYDFFHENFNSNSEAQACLVFDGIDEAAQEDIKELVNQLNDYFTSCANIRILLVGRPETQAITSHLDSFSAGNIDVSSTLNSQDISVFVDHSYKKYLSHHKVKGLRKIVTNSLREKANGMFLWVDLVCQELAKIKMVAVLKQHLDSMPTKLSDLYDSIFTRIAKMVLNSKDAAQLQKLFFCLSQSTEPPNVFDLNQLIRYATNDPDFDVELTIEKYCASLLVCEQTGALLFRTKINLEDNQKHNRSLTGSTRDSEESASEGEEDSDSEFLDEEAADREVESREIETKVKVRHASISDFLNSKELKTSPIVLNHVDASFHAVQLSLRIVCEGDLPQPTISESLWLYAMTNIFDQLRKLDDAAVSPQQIEYIIEKLWQLFNSEPLARFISRHHSTRMGYPLYKSFDFGFNIDLDNTNRQAVQKWIKKANESEIHMKPETQKWVENIIQTPLQLLVPLTKTCIREWLSSDDAPRPLYLRFSFAWLCLVSTNLIPPCNPFSWDDDHDYPLLGSSDKFNALANIVESERSVGVHCRIAKTAACVEEGKIAEIEWKKAIELAEAIKDHDTLKDIYYKSIQSLTDMRLLRCEPMVLPLAEKYLALDSSNARIHACLGLGRLRHLGDSNGAIDEFRTALALDPRDNCVLMALIDVLWDHGDRKGILELFENGDSDLISYRMRACTDKDSYPDVLAQAARYLGKIEHLVECYETTIMRPWTKPPVGKEYGSLEDGWGTLGEAYGKLNLKEFYAEGTALLQCRLAHLHSRYRDDSRSALNLWTATFLEQSEIFGLSELNYDYSIETIPMLMDTFAELLYEDALNPDGSINEQSLRSLERLRKRQNWLHEQSSEISFEVSLTNQRNLNLFLAKLYRQTGRNAEARELLSEQFERGIELLNDDFDWNDYLGYHVLSKILFTYCQKDNAAIAQSLRRYSRYQPEENENLGRSESSVNVLSTLKGEQECTEEPQVPSEKGGNEDGDEDDKSPTGIVERCGFRGYEFQCSMSFDCPNPQNWIGSSPFFVCMTCIGVQFCEGCYARHTYEVGASIATPADQPFAKGEKRISVCSSRHEHIKVPMDDWRLKDDIMTIAGKEIPVRRWLEELHI